MDCCLLRDDCHRVSSRYDIQIGFDQARLHARSVTVTRIQGDARKRSSGTTPRVIELPCKAKDADPCP